MIFTGEACTPSTRERHRLLSCPLSIAQPRTKLLGSRKSNTPMQALQLLNDVQHVEAARNFAEKIIQKGGKQDQTKISWAWRAATSRNPSREEIEIVQDLLNQNRKRYAQDLKSAEDLIGFGESEPDAKIKPIELAPWTLVANMILNLDEVVNKN